MKIMGISGGVGSDNRRVQRPPFLTKFVAEVGPKKRFPEDPSQLSFKLFQYCGFGKCVESCQIVSLLIRGLSLCSTHILQHTVLAGEGIFFINPPMTYE